MSNRKLILRENHHWWPEGLSSHWMNNYNLINVITPNEKTFCSPPKKLGCIAGGHNVILNKPSKFDHTFEGEFDKVDSDFKMVIEVLTEVIKKHLKYNISEVTYYEHSYDNEFLNNLCNCMVSLLVRAPMTRNEIVGIVEAIGTPMSKKDFKMLSAANMIGKLDEITKRLKDKGKFVILYSKDYLFYKSERPTLIKEFLINKHLELNFNKYIEKLFNNIPGCFINP